MGERRLTRMSVCFASVALAASLATACTGSSGGSPSASQAPSPTQETPSPTEGSPSGAPAATIEIPPVDGPYDWTIDAADFVTTVDNPYFPLEPGTTFVFVGTSEGEREVVTVRVTDRTKMIQGVTCVVVRDTVRTGGEVTEDTFDWYAQDVDGNVWYMGEDTKEYDHGEVVSTEGSWEGGVHGALPGVIMPADPTVGLAYTQEHYAGQAEDKGKIVALGRQASVPYGSFDDVLITEDWTPLEPNVLERKSYAPGIGVVFEELVRGGQEVLRLVEVHAAG
jgi:hypothetical protein